METGRTGAIRVAHVIHGLMIGGLEQLVVRLCETGQRFGVEPQVIAFGRDGPVRELLLDLRIPLCYLGEVRGLSPLAIHGIGRALQRQRAQVAHAHDLGPWLNSVAARPFSPRTRTVATFHQVSTPVGFTRGAALAASMASDALVACGDEVRACVKQWAHRGTPLELIGNGVPLGPPPTAAERARARAQLKIPQDATVIGFVGRLHHEKGVDLLLEAFLQELAQRPLAHLVLIGGGQLEASLRQRVAEAGCTRVHLTGEVLGASSLLPALDIYVQPSRREGRSLSMLEAMAAGLPTVAQALPAISEIHLDLQTALLVPVAPRPRFGPAIVRLLEDEGLRLRLGQRAREHVKRFSMEAMAQAYAALYRRVAGAKEQGAA